MIESNDCLRNVGHYHNSGARGYMNEYNDQGIDLRPYLAELWDKRFWIVGFGILGVVLSLIISLIVPPTYEATALVAVTLPRERLEFDARIQTVTESQPMEAYPDLALSDSLLVQLLERTAADQSLTLEQLRKMVDVSTGSDPSIINLTVEHEDPEIAAEMADTWAELFVVWANVIFGSQGDEQLIFFETRLNEAASQLEAAEQALVDFQVDNRSTILANELLAAEQTQADYLAKKRQIELILQDIESLIPQAGDSNSTKPIATDRLASILLQIRALGGISSGTPTTPFQIQFNLEGPADGSTTDNLDTLIQLRDVLVAQGGQIQERLALLEPQILALQQEKFQMEVLNNRLNRDFEVAEETYTTLARTVDEKRITSADTTSGVKMAGKTAVPERPSSPNIILNAIVAGMAGLLLSSLAIIVMRWWRVEGSSERLTESRATE